MPLVIALVLLALAAVAAVGVALVALRRARRSHEAAVGELAELRERLAVLERADLRGSTTEIVAAEREFVITHLGESESGDQLPAKVSLTAPAFADAVLRESVVQTAALVHGLRRALAPEARNRIRFEMKRELKRSRKARKVELKAALREYRARHRAEVPPDVNSALNAEDVA